MKSTAVFSAAVALLALASVLSCGDDDPSGIDPDTPFPHTIPSQLTMQADTNDLAGGGLAPASGACHAVSAIAVGWIDLNVKIRLAVPVAAFIACAAQTPVYVGDGTWIWTASGGAGAGAWTADLTGQVASTTQVAWEMRVSGTASGFDRFLWFSGQCDFAATHGSWLYFDPQSQQEQQELIQCDWTYFGGEPTMYTVAFRNVDEGGAGYGDLLRYAYTTPLASISLADASNEDTTRISWDTATGAGMLVNAEGDSCCWGERPLFPDVECP